jgi:hypothetical protein
MDRIEQGTPRFLFTNRCRPIAQIGVADSRIETIATIWDGANWDDVTSWWVGTEPLWEDMACEAFSFECEYGRMRTTDRYMPGTAMLQVRNASGWADPIHSEDPNLTTNMRPGRPIRVGIEHKVYGRRWLFRGFIDSVTPTYDPEDYEVVQLDCIDALGEVNRVKFAGFTNQWPQENAQARIIRILNQAQWPSAKRSLDANTWLMIASDQNGQVADHLAQTAESVGGVVFGDTEGNVCFRTRDWQVFGPTRPVDGTIGNVEVTDICPGAWVRPFARADISTRIIAGRDAETAYVLDDVPNQVQYGIEPFDRTKLLTASDTAIQDLAATWLKNRSASTSPRVRSVELDARMSDPVLDLMFSVDVFVPSRYRCRLLIERGLVFDDEYFATGVTHSWDANHWELDLKLDRAAPYEAPEAKWDDNLGWDEDVWVALNPLIREVREMLTSLREAGVTP